jgi:flagellar basal-body rod protein FlgB
MLRNSGEEMNKVLKWRVNSFFIQFWQTVPMDPTKIPLFDLAEKRLAWTAQRQNILAANIANANTPGFEGRDVESFARVLAGTATVGPVMTQPRHMAGTAPSGLTSLITDPPKARALDGNTVALDEQLTKVADTDTTQGMVTGIWKKYMSMFNMALGRS